jgi:GDP-L-fucose synthase
MLVVDRQTPLPLKPEGMTTSYDLSGKRIWVAGHRGMVGAAVMRRLASENCTLLTASRAELDLRDQAATNAWIERNRPNVVVIAAAKVGGILANNDFPADFLYDNLAMEVNIVEASHRIGVEKLLFLGSSCIYPKMAPQPMPEDSLLTGPLEPTNQWYAIAKIAGLMLCRAYRIQHKRDFISGMPTNLYGPGDNFDLQSSHVLPALIRKAHEARLRGSRTLEIWGTGAPLREFMHVDDCADAIVHLLKHYSGLEHVNIGTGQEITILELAKLVARIVGFKGEIVCDVSKPDGTPRKLIDCTKLLATGWMPRISLEDGIAATYRWFLDAVRGEGRLRA